MKSLLAAKFLAQAEAAEGAGRDREAVSLYKKVLEYDRHNLRACDRLIVDALMRRDHAHAARYLRIVIEHRGPDADSLMMLAKCHLEAGNPPAAIAAYKELLHLIGRKRGREAADLRKFAQWQIDALEFNQAVAGGEEDLELIGDYWIETPPAPRARPAAQRPAARPAQPKAPQQPAAPLQAPASGPAPAPKPAPPKLPEEAISVSVALAQDALSALLESPAQSDLRWLRQRLDFNRLTLLREYEDLLCLPSLQGVEKFWYQIETVKRVLRDFGGRVLFADEVGLGKTIEAGMALKEFLLRGLVRTVLILTPPALVSQWREELQVKFGLDFSTGDDGEAVADGSLWQQDRVIASINLAKSKAHRDRVAARAYDLLIVDEAHHLKNRETLSWQLVNQIQKKYLFLLSATPVQNNLIELFNLITLLRPGTLKTEAAFRKHYIQRGAPQQPAHSEELRELLRGVMIRNTRSLVDLKLPKRFAVTLVVEPSEPERDIYAAVSELVRGDAEAPRPAGHKSLLTTLLRQAGSSPFALRETLRRYPSSRTDALVERIGQLQDTEKGVRLVELLQEKPGEKVIVFTQFRHTLAYLAGLLERAGIDCRIYHGGLAAEDKERALREFRGAVPVLLATESGGEGHNIHFARTLVNFDLPWNPMRIEQRIGRLHRIGQTQDVFVFNLCLRDTLEHYLLEVLDQKINLFELVVGEVDMILGHLDEERDFGDLVFELWRGARDRSEARSRFDELGERLKQAKTQYLETQALDQALFRDEFEA